MTQDQLEGAARELIVASDLMRRGFEVFRAACANSTFDLVASKHDMLLRVEVVGERSGGRVPKNSPVGGTGKRDCHRFDIIAAVNGEKIRYLRSVLHAFNCASRELVRKETTNPKTTKKNLIRRNAMQKETKC